jgi:hypothetical protein
MRSSARRTDPSPRCGRHDCGGMSSSLGTAGPFAWPYTWRHTLATLVWLISMPGLSNSPWIRGAPHSGLAMLISRISRRSSAGTVGRPERGRDFGRQYDLNPARCQQTTVSGPTSVSALRVVGTKRQPNKDQAIHGTKGQSLRQMTALDVKLMTKDQDLSFYETRDRNNKTSTDQTRLQASLIRQKHCAIRPHLPAGLDFRQGQPTTPHFRQL